jgi:hypothetical protein
MGRKTGLRFPAGMFSLTATTSRPVVGAVQSLNQWGRRSYSKRVNWFEREADHTPLLGAKVWSTRRFTSTSLVHYRSVVIRQEDNFVFNLPTN